MSAFQKRCIHDGVKPCPEYFGIMFTAKGRDCCSELEGEFKNTDGSFDEAGAEKQCAMTRAAGQFNGFF